jgi:glycogen synthase
MSNVKGGNYFFKVCLIIPETFPSIGGFENLVNDLSIELSGKIEVHIVCNNYNKVGDFLSSKGIIIHEFPRYIKIKYFGAIIDSFINNIKLLYLVRKERICVINAHPIFPGGLYAILSHICGTPLICTSHGGDIQINNEINYGSRRDFFVNFLTKFILKMTDYHTVVSKSMVSDAVKAGSDPLKVRVIYNGLNLRNIPKQLIFLSSNYHLSKKDFFILYIGRLHAKKCPDDLIKAMQIVISEIPTAKLVIAGKGDEEQKLKELVSQLNLSDNVFFAGFVSDEEKWQLMINCDVFVLPSEIEAFGITVIEAMACSKPVIVTDIGPFTEIVKHKETGLVVPLHSPKAIADGIIELYQNIDLRKKIADSARRDIENRFDIVKISEDYLNLYKEAYREKSKWVVKK